MTEFENPVKDPTLLRSLTALTEDAGNIVDLSTPQRRHRFRREMMDLRHFMPLFQTYHGIDNPAHVRNRLVSIETQAHKAIDNPNSVNSLPAKVKRHLARCRTTRAQLEFQCGLVVDPEHTEWAVGDGRARTYLEGTFSRPDELSRLAGQALEDLQPKIKSGRGGNRHLPDWAFKEVLRLLGILYEELSGKKPAISVDPGTGAPTGKFLHFARICLTWLGYDKSDEAIRAKFREIRHHENW